MENSSYYLGRIRAYNKVINQIEGLKGYFDDCSNSISNSLSYLECLFVNGKQIDDGVLSSISSNLGVIFSSLNPMIDECNKMIKHYEKLYHAALLAEKKEKYKNI